MRVALTAPVPCTRPSATQRHQEIPQKSREQTIIQLLHSSLPLIPPQTFFSSDLLSTLQRACRVFTSGGGGGGGGGAIEPPKTGGGGFGKRARLTGIINQSL